MDKQTLNALVDEYILKNYVPDDYGDIQESDDGSRSLFSSILGDVAEEESHAIGMLESPRRRKTSSAFHDFSYLGNRKLNFDINKKFKDKGETFSEMLSRFIKESGEKNADIYNRANIKRQHFSKIMNDEDYQPTKPTVLAFAIALKLSFEKTRELLASAGYILSNAKKFDLVISACLENKFYDIYEINEILEERDLPLLGYF